MTTAYTNRANLPLSVAVFLANDNYDHDSRSNHISTTSLLKATRQLVLTLRVPPEELTPDVANLSASRMGSAIHDSIENAWVEKHEQSLTALGYPKKIVKRIRVNPTPVDLTEEPDIIPVYLEQRSEKEINGFIISGKFDFIGDGRVEDFKTTSAYTYVSSNKDDDYIMQGSIYRWLNPDIITRDDMAIIYFFKDWAAVKAATDKRYPQAPIVEKVFQLKTVAETEAFIFHKTSEIRKYLNAPESEIPHCSEKELWQSETVYKYYKKPEAKRATKDFKTDRIGAYAHANINGGFVREIPGTVRACNYCDAQSICTQRQQLIATGQLIAKE